MSFWTLLNNDGWSCERKQIRKRINIRAAAYCKFVFFKGVRMAQCQFQKKDWGKVWVCRSTKIKFCLPSTWGVMRMPSLKADRRTDMKAKLNWIDENTFIKAFSSPFCPHVGHLLVPVPCTGWLTGGWHEGKMMMKMASLRHFHHFNSILLLWLLSAVGLPSMKAFSSRPPLV